MNLHTINRWLYPFRSTRGDEDPRGGAPRGELGGREADAAAAGPRRAQECQGQASTLERQHRRFRTCAGAEIVRGHHRRSSGDKRRWMCCAQCTPRRPAKEVVRRSTSRGCLQAWKHDRARRLDARRGASRGARDAASGRSKTGILTACSGGGGSAGRRADVSRPGEMTPPASRHARPWCRPKLRSMASGRSQTGILHARAAAVHTTSRGRLLAWKKSRAPRLDTPPRGRRPGRGLGLLLHRLSVPRTQPGAAGRGRCRTAAAAAPTLWGRAAGLADRPWACRAPRDHLTHDSDDVRDARLVMTLRQTIRRATRCAARRAREHAAERSSRIERAAAEQNRC